MRQLRERLASHQPALAFVSQRCGHCFWVTVTQKKDDSTCGTRQSPMVTRERQPCVTPFFHTSLRLLNLITRGGSPQPLGSYALFQRLIAFLSIYLWLILEIFTATPMSSRTWGIGPFRVITQQRTSCRSKANNSESPEANVCPPSWVSKHPVFCPLLQRLHDDHRFSS